MSLGDPKGDLFSPQRLRGNWGRNTNPTDDPRQPPAPQVQAAERPRPLTELAISLRSMIESDVENASGRFMQHALSALDAAIEERDEVKAGLAINAIEELLDETVITIR